MKRQSVHQTQYCVHTHDRRGTVLVVLVVVMAILALVVAGAVRPVRDESDIATLRVETTRAFYAAESGAIILMNAVIGQSTMPTNGDTVALGNQTISFVQIPDATGVAIVEGLSGDAIRRIEFTTQ
jgi:type II secretory pathway pseudopilin PulG